MKPSPAQLDLFRQELHDHSQRVVRAAGDAVLQAIRRQTPPRLDDPDKLLTVQQVADTLHCDPGHVADLYDEGVLTGIDIASPNASRRCLRIHARSVTALSSANSVSSASSNSVSSV